MGASLLVTGGTGTLGRSVVPRLVQARGAVRVLSRSGHEPHDGIEYALGDLATGAGLDRALDGIETIVHCAGSAKGDEIKTANLVWAARDTAVKHLVFISVVGADRIPVRSRVDRAMFGYFASKRAAEKVVESSRIPWTILRATQFYDLMFMVAGYMTKLPVIPAPTGMRFQPVDTDEVAQRLVELALGEPAGYVPEMAGPRVYGVPKLVSEYLDANHKRRPVIAMPLPGQAAQAIRAGANLARDGQLGHRTWEEFLDERVHSG